MKVLLILKDRALAQAAVAAIQAQSHDVVWILSLDYKQKGETANGTKVPISLNEFDLAIIGDGTTYHDPSGQVQAANIPFVSCLDNPVYREIAIEDGAVLELSPTILVQALKENALEISAAVTWIPGKAAERANAEAAQGAVPDSGGWTGSRGWIRNSVSLQQYIAALRRSSSYPGNIADDITEPHYSRLAKIDLQDQLRDLGERVQIERIEGLTALCRGKVPKYILRFRGCAFSFKSA